MSVVVPSAAEFEASERLFRRELLAVVQPGQPYPPKRVEYAEPVTVAASPRYNPSGLRIECDADYNWIIIAEDVDGISTIATFDMAATYGTVVGVLNRLKALWAKAWDEGFAEGLDDGWNEGYRAGRATFDGTYIG